MAKARGKGGKFTSPSSADAVITVTTVLDGADQVAMGFDEMSDSAREYQHTLADGNKENISYAEGNFVMAESLDKVKKKQNASNVETAASIIVLQGATSATNQFTGGIYKTIGGLNAMGLLNEEDARKWQEKARILETFTGIFEIVLAGYTLYIAYGAYVTATTAGITAAKTAETAAVTANTVAWYANPVFWIGAAMVVALGVLIYAIATLADRFNVLTKAVNAAGDALRFFQEASHDAQEKVKETIDTFVDIITLEPLKEGLVGV